MLIIVKPSVKINPGGTINVTEHKSLQLECNYTSNDNTSTRVSWNTTLDGYIKQISNPVFKFDSITRFDAGQYTCLVSNLAGKTEDTVIVNVLCKYWYSIKTSEKEKHIVLSHDKVSTTV